MGATPHRRRFVLATAAAAAVAVSLSACSAVVDGSAVAGDRGPCTKVGTPMQDVPAKRSTEPAIRIPAPAGWERTPELEQDDSLTRLALADDDAAVIVMVRAVPEDDPSVIFDDFHTGMLTFAEEEGLSADMTRTPNTLCGLPSETVTVAGADPFQTVVVVAESAGDTYLIAVVQAGGEDPEQRSEVDAVLSGIEVLPQEAAAS